MKLSCNNLTCDRGGRRVFHKISLHVETGEALIVRGPNGSGKSSLLRVIAGFVGKAGGEIALEGGDKERSVPEHCHYFGHQDALKPALSVQENLSFWQQFYEPVPYETGNKNTTLSIEEALDTLGILHTAQLPAGFLSAGQKRRLSLARLLVVSRPIWIMDEPSAALDAASEKVLLGLMAEHLNKGGLLLAATHLPLDLPNTHFLDIASSDSLEDEDARSDDQGDYWL
ncbi:heme ABC exporter ATP-binding protein CcmA [Flexibacterium corallicola]|uniref:heme ABC exporter ATP-binding protein CcmA n=1 Tax=Flexibacterium corallicola TaxID=3037259 RepID=UPI00286F2B52|nr:heme ABC exporter ATP-binding protein CcmA [Pseudovibrio sp. M1P-2-3]